MSQSESESNMRHALLSFELVCGTCVPFVCTCCAADEGAARSAAGFGFDVTDGAILVASCALLPANRR